MLVAHCSLVLAIGLVSCAHVLGKNINPFAGPYIAYLHRAESCPSDGSFTVNLRNSRFHPARPMELQSVWGNVTLKIPVDDFVWGNINVAVRSNNQWKDNAFIFDFPMGACSALRDHFSGVCFKALVPPGFPVLLRLIELDLKRTDPCLIPPGQYDIKNQTIKWVAPKIKVMPYGHYRATITAGSRGSRIKKYCSKAELELIPKLN